MDESASDAEGGKLTSKPAGPIAALRTGDCADGVKQTIANKIIALAKAGERNPDILCEQVLKDIRTPQQWAASEPARSLVLGEQEAAPS
jgi:hypothetical protein